jgi:hypothetical protein
LDKRFLGVIGLVAIVTVGSVMYLLLFPKTNTSSSSASDKLINDVHSNLTKPKRESAASVEVKNPIANVPEPKEESLPSDSTEPNKTSLIYVHVINSLTGRPLKGVPVYATPLPPYIDRCCERTDRFGHAITPRPLYCFYDISGGAFPKPDRSVRLDGGMFNPPCFNKMYVTNGTGWVTISDLPANVMINDRGVPAGSATYYLLTLRAPMMFVPPWDSVPIGNVAWAIVPLHSNQTISITLGIPSTLEVRKLMITLIKEGGQTKWDPSNITVGLGDVVRLKVINGDKDNPWELAYHGFILNGKWGCCDYAGNRMISRQVGVTDLHPGREFEFDPFIVTTEGVFHFWDLMDDRIVDGKLMNGSDLEIGRFNVVRDWNGASLYASDLMQASLKNDQQGSRLNFTVVNNGQKDLGIANLTLSAYASLLPPTFGIYVKIPASDMRIPWRNEGNNTVSFSVNFDVRVTTGSIYLFEVGFVDGHNLRTDILAN